MRWLSRIVRRSWYLLHRGSAEREMDEEMRFHLEMEIEERVRRGMSPEEARRTALMDFGGVERFKEEGRDARGTRPLEELLMDLRFALRSLRKRPGSSLAAALTIAVGLGVATAVYSWANWLLFRPVPGVVSPDRLVAIEFANPERAGGSTGISLPNLRDLARSAPSLALLAGHARTSLQIGGDGIAPINASGDVVAGDYFATLGVRPQLGRFFQSDELDPEGAARVVVISDPLWRSHFGAAPDAIGRQLRINAIEYTIVGVAPPGFRGTDRVDDIDAWLTPSAYPLLRHSASMGLSERRVSALQEVIGRLQPTATPAMAQADLRSAMATLVAEYPEVNEIYATYLASIYPVGMPKRLLARATTTVRLLLGITAIVVIIACANTANLLLIRGVHRRGEYAVRRALGASTGRILRQHVSEGLLLALCGGVLGVAIAMAVVKLFATQRLLGFPPFEQLQVDWRVLAFAAALCLATGIGFGMVPAFFTIRSDYAAHLKEAARSEVGGPVRLRNALTIVQIAAAMSLVVGALLLAQTLYRLWHVEVGFDPDHVVAIGINPNPQGYSPEKLKALRRELLADLTNQPGVSAVSLASAAPFSGSYTRIDFRPADNATQEWTLKGATTFYITPEYFSALRVPILTGRTFSQAETDGGATDVVVLSRSAARRLFGDADPIGRRITAREFKGTRTHTVIGVVADTRSTKLKEPPELAAYQPINLAWNPYTIVLLRSPRPRAEVEALVHSAVATLDPSLPLFRVETLEESIARHLSDERLFARLVGLLATLAAILAAVGLYAVVACSVAERTREIGVRMALGARAPAVVALVVRQSTRIVAGGLVVGTIIAVMLSRVLESRLFGITRLDVPTYLAAGGVAIALGLIASAIPARTATRIDPVEALRHD